MRLVPTLTRQGVISAWLRRNPYLLLMPASLAMLAISASADPVGAKTSGNWETGAIWTFGTVPTSSDDVFIGSVYPGSPDPAPAKTATVALTADESAADLYLGYSDGSLCMGTLDLGASHLTIAGNLWIGKFANGFGTIMEEGGSFTTSSLLVFHGNSVAMGASDVTSAIDIEDADTVLTTTATGNITNGGAIANGATLRLGANLNVGAAGALNVESTGAITTLDMNGHNIAAPLLDLGYDLTAAVTLDRGSETPGTLTLNNLQIGNGQNLTLIAGDVITGIPGAIDIDSGATLTTVAASNVTTTVNVVAGTLNLGANLSIGTQTVNAANGSMVNLAGHNLACSYLLLGYAGTSTVTLNRGSGGPGILTVGNLFMGNRQTLNLLAGDTISNGTPGLSMGTPAGGVNVTDGAILTTVATSNISGNDVYVLTGGTMRLGAGLNLSGGNNLTVQDSGSVFNAQGNPVTAGIISVGASGTAAVSVSDLGPVTASELHVGNGSWLTLHGGGVIDNLLDLASGSIEITNGTVKVASGDFGEIFVGSPDLPTPQGSIIVDGKGSALQTEKQLTLSGNASLTISDHGAVSVLGAGGSMAVLGSADGPAIVDVSGGSTMKVNGLLAVLTGGKVTVDATSKVSVGSGAFGSPGSLSVTKGGILGGNPDEIDANVMVASGGSLVPSTGPGSLTIHGNYTGATGSFFLVALDGATPETDFGVLHVSGTATVGGTLVVQVASGFTPGTGQAFTILQAGTVKGKFSKVVGATATYTPTGISIVPIAPATPFEKVAGTYQGLAPVTAGSGLEGRLALTVATTGKFTGQFTIGGKMYNFANTLTSGGTYSGTITTGGQTLTVNLTADLTGASQAIAGSIGIGGASYGVDVDRAAFSATNPPPVVGAYTIVLPPNSDNSDLNAPRPQGTGWATATVSASGSVRVVGKLADGTAFSAGGLLASDNSVALYAPLYMSAGLVSGALTFPLPAAKPGAAMGDVAGTLAWSKPAQATNKVFPKPFSTALTASGSAYGPPTKGNRIFFDIDSTGDAVLTFSGAGLPTAVTKDVVLSTADLVSYPHPANAMDKLTLTFTAGTGAFSGTFINPVTSVKTAFSGVVLQNSQMGEGFFLGSSDSGTVELAPQP